MLPFSPDLLDALEASEVEQVGGTVWRQILLPTSVMRPNQRGGRWNPPGIEALYCSLDPDTAAAEIDYLMSRQPVPITRQRVTYSLKTTISRVADLRPEPWAEQFDYAYDPAKSEECVLIGAAAAWLGFGGLIVRSQRSPGDNLAIFVANLDVDDIVEASSSGFDYPPGPPSDHHLPPLSLMTS